MEWLALVFVRPRQARYQAALRPDMKGTIDSKALSNFTATAIRCFARPVAHWLRWKSNQSRWRNVRAQHERSMAN